MSEYYNTFSAYWDYAGSEAYMVHLNGQYYLGVGYYDGYDPQVFMPLKYESRKGTRKYYVANKNSLSETTVSRNGNGKFQEMIIDFEYGIIELTPRDYRCMMAAFKSINVMKEKLEDFIYSK